MRRLLLVFILIILTVTQPGCWDRQEVEDLAIMTAIGIEPAPGGRIKLLVQIIDPASLTKAAGGGGGSGGEVAAKPYRNISAEGDTVLEAARALSLGSPRRLFLSHTQMIFFSEDLVRDRGVREFIDFFERDPRVRHSTWLLVGKGDLFSLLDIPGRLESTPSLRIASVIRKQPINSQYAVLNLGDFIRTMESESTQPYTAVAEAIPNPSLPKDPGHTIEKGQQPELPYTIRMTGTAVFRGEKLAGYLDQTESRGLLWVRGEVNGGVVKAPGPNGQGFISLEILRSKTNMRPEIREGQVYMTLQVEVESNLDETSRPLDLEKTETMSQLEGILASAVQGEIDAALKKAQQEYQSDVFGFGEALSRKYPRQWEEMKPRWPQIFPTVQVQCQIKAKIRRTGTIGQPAKSKEAF